MSDTKLGIGRSGVRMSLLAGSATAVAGFLYLLYKSRAKKAESEFDLPRDTVILILRDFRKEFYTLCKMIASHSTRFQETIRVSRRVAPAEMRQLLQEYYDSPQSGIPDQIQDIENKVYLKHDVGNRKEFERFYATLAKEDVAVRAYRDEIKDMFDKAIMGVATTPALDIPERVTPDMLVAAYRKYFKASLKKMIDYAFDFITLHGRAKVKTPLFDQGFQRLNLEEDRNNIAREFGVDFREDFYPHQLMTFCKERFDKVNPDFARKMNELETFRYAFIARIFEAELTKEALLEELQQIDVVGVPVPENRPIVIATEADLPKHTPEPPKKDEWVPEDHHQVPNPGAETQPHPAPEAPTDIVLPISQVLEDVPVIDSAQAVDPAPQTDSG